MINLDNLKVPAWSRQILRRARSALSVSDTLRRFVSLASWSLISFALDKAAMLIIVFMLARILEAADYGRLTLAQGLVNSLQIFIVLGMGSILGRYIPAMLEEGVQRAIEIINLCATIVFGTTAVFAVAALASARIVAVDVLDVPTTSFIPYWMLIWIVLTALNSLLLTVMLSFEKGQALGLVSLLGAALSIAAVPAMAASMGVEGAIGGMVAIEAAKLIALSALYARLIKGTGVPILTPPRRSDLPLLYKFGLPVFLLSALWMPTIWISQFIVKNLAPNGLAAVGVFGFANNVLGAVILVSSLTNRAALPVLSSLHAQGRFAELRRMSLMMALGQLAAAAVIGLPLMLAAPFIMTLAGPTFASDWPVLVIMIATGIVIAGQTALGNYLLVQGRVYLLLGTMAIWTTVVLSTATLLGDQGAYALAWALLIGTIVRIALIWAATNDARFTPKSLI